MKVHIYQVKLQKNSKFLLIYIIGLDQPGINIQLLIHILDDPKFHPFSRLISG